MLLSLKLRIPSDVTALKWLFCFLTAVLLSAVAFTMGLAISAMYSIREEMAALIASDNLAVAYLIYGTFNTACACLAAVCVLYGAAPASGSGLPELASLLNGVDVPSFLTMKTLLLKSMGACGSVAAALPLGYQGVLLHIGGMIASLLATQLPHFELTCGAKREAQLQASAPGHGPVNHCMTAVNPSSRFAEYTSEPVLPLSAWRRRLPQLVEGLTRRLPGSLSRLSSQSIAAGKSLGGSRTDQEREVSGEGSARAPWLGITPRGGDRRASSNNTLQLRDDSNATGGGEWLERIHFIASTTLSDQVACGAAAGAAAAFRAPIGGMLYVMEISTRWRIELTWRTFFSTSVTVLSLKLISHACDRSQYCSTVQSFVNVAGPGYEYSFTRPYAQLPLMIVLAAAVGLLGSAFVKLNASIVKLRRHWSHSKSLLLMEVDMFPRAADNQQDHVQVVIVTLAYSMTTLTLIMAGTCRRCDHDAPNHCNPGLVKNALATSRCLPGSYNDMATLVVSPNGDNIRSMWSMAFKDFSLMSLMLFVPVYFVFAAWTSGLAIPSGSFSPMVFLGSCIGRLCAHLLQQTGIVQEPDAGLYSLLGAAGFFTGQTRMTVSLCVIMLEMCHAEGTLPFLMVVIIVAKGVADRLGDSIVLRRIKLKNLPFLERMPHLTLRRGQHSAREIVNKDDFPMLPRDPQGSLIQDMLDQHPFKPVFVIVKPLEGIGASSVANIPDMDASSAADSAVWEPLVVPVTGSSALMAGMVSDRETSLPVSGTASQDDLETQGITRHVILGVVARSTLEKVLASLGACTAPLIDTRHQSSLAGGPPLIECDGGERSSDGGLSSARDSSYSAPAVGLTNRSHKTPLRSLWGSPSTTAQAPFQGSDSWVAVEPRSNQYSTVHAKAEAAATGSTDLEKGSNAQLHQGLVPSFDSLSGPIFQLDSWEGLHPEERRVGGLSSAQLTAGSRSTQSSLDDASIPLLGTGPPRGTAPRLLKSIIRSAHRPTAHAPDMPAAPADAFPSTHPASARAPSTSAGVLPAAAASRAHETLTAHPDDVRHSTGNFVDYTHPSNAPCRREAHRAVGYGVPPALEGPVGNLLDVRDRKSSVPEAPTSSKPLGAVPSRGSRSYSSLPIAGTPGSSDRAVLASLSEEQCGGEACERDGQNGALVGTTAAAYTDHDAHTNSKHEHKMCPTQMQCGSGDDAVVGVAGVPPRQPAAVDRANVDSMIGLGTDRTEGRTHDAQGPGRGSFDSERARSMSMRGLLNGRRLSTVLRSDSVNGAGPRHLIQLAEEDIQDEHDDVRTGAPWQGTLQTAYSTPPSDVFCKKSCTPHLARQDATGPAVELEADDMPDPTENAGTPGVESCQDLPSERPSERASHVFSAASGSWTVSVSSELPTEAFLSPRLSAPPDTTPAATSSGAESTVHDGVGESEPSGMLDSVYNASHISDGHVPDAPTNTAQEQGASDNAQLGSIDDEVRGSQDLEATLRTADMAVGGAFSLGHDDELQQLPDASQQLPSSSQGMEPIDIARDIQASMPLESPKAPFVGSPSAGHPISAPSEPATSTAVDTSANPAAGFAENVSRVSDHSIYDSTCAQQSDGDWQPQITVPQLRLQPSTRQHWRSADQADGKPAVFRAQMQPSGDLDGDAGRDGDVTGREGEVSFSGRLRRGSCGGLAPASSCGSDPGSRGRLDKKVPPVSMDPSVSLEAIFSMMNNMAIEIVPIVSTGGVYHGLLTRECMMRFQRKYRGPTEYASDS